MLLELPKEIWVKIFGYLDFKSLQHDATRVCKYWFEIIRNDSTLSGKVAISAICNSEINSILIKWNKLKILYFPNLFGGPNKGQVEYLLKNSNAEDKTNYQTDLKIYKQLEKVIIKHNFESTVVSRNSGFTNSGFNSQ